MIPSEGMQTKSHSGKGEESRTVPAPKKAAFEKSKEEKKDVNF